MANAHNPEPDDDVETFTTDVDSPPQSIVPAEGDQLLWLKSLELLGKEFVGTYLPAVTEPALRNYDDAFREWLNDQSGQYDEQEVVKIVGGYLGNKLVADFDMEWVIVEDEYGPGYAVRSKTVEVMSFPFDAVVKRVEDREYDFVYGIHHTIAKMLTNGEYKPR